jgi:2,3-diketo-5-methylthio-1-phosphopentane phosphatase
MSLARLHVFSDFDGTITRPDTLRVLVEHLGAGMAYYRAGGRMIVEGQLTLRDGIARELACIRVPFSDAADVLRAHVTLDPGFGRLARWCRLRDARLTILSAGLEELVALFLVVDALPGVEVRANRLRPGTWECIFRDDSPFGHDKAAAVREARAGGWETVMIGDGLSDHAPAEAADHVWAKRGLAEWCRTRGVPHHEFTSFDEIVHSLEKGSEP